MLAKVFLTQGLHKTQPAALATPCRVSGAPVRCVLPPSGSPPPGPRSPRHWRPGIHTRKFCSRLTLLPEGVKFRSWAGGKVNRVRTAVSRVRQGNELQARPHQGEGQAPQKSAELGRSKGASCDGRRSHGHESAPAARAASRRARRTTRGMARAPSGSLVGPGRGRAARPWAAAAGPGGEAARPPGVDRPVGGGWLWNRLARGTTGRPVGADRTGSVGLIGPGDDGAAWGGWPRL